MNLRNSVPSGLISTGSLDLTGRAYGGLIQGDSLRITHTSDTDPAFDLQGSQQFDLINFRTSLAAGAAPAARMKRDGGSAGIHYLHRFDVDGYPAVACVEMDGAEACQLDQCSFDTAAVDPDEDPPAPALYLHTTSGGLLTATFRNCNFSMGTDNTVLGKVVHLNRIGNDLKEISFVDCIWHAEDGNPLAGLYCEDDGGVPQNIRIVRCRFECSTCEYGIFVDGSSSLLQIEQCVIIAKQPIRLAGSEHAALRIAGNSLYSTNDSPLIRVSQTNYNSYIDVRYLMSTGSTAYLLIDSSAIDTLILAEDETRVSGTVAASSVIQTRQGAVFE